MEITFDGFLLNSEQIIIKYPIKASRPRRTSRYIFPELGMVDASIREINRLILKSENPRIRKIKESLTVLKERLLIVRSKRSFMEQVHSVELTFEKDKLIRDAIRVLVLAAGGGAISKSSWASRLQLELILLDILIQDPDLIEKKIMATIYE